jgi:Flp pilus assembly protein TadG
VVPVIRGLRKRLVARSEDERGAVALLVVGLLAAMLGLAAIVVDLGNARDRQRQAQTAADSAALAAAQYMFTANPADPAVAVQLARQYIDVNSWTSDASTVTVDITDGVVDVRLPTQQSPSFFAGALGSSAPSVSASAQARWKGGASINCVLCVLANFDGQVGSTLHSGGTVLINGKLTFNNDNNGSIKVDPPTAGDVGYYESWDGYGDFGLWPPVQMPFTMPDPFAGLPLPPPGADTGPIARIGAGSCDPGVYADVSGCTSFTGGGTYVLTGGPKVGDITFNNTIPANDSLFYVTCYSQDAAKNVHYAPCGPGIPGATLDGTGNGDATLNGRTTGDPRYRGFSVIFDRGFNCGAKGCMQSLVGKYQLTVNGTVYGSAITLDERGVGLFVDYGNVVVGDVALDGQGANKVHMDIRGNGAPITTRGPGSPVLLSH